MKIWFLIFVAMALTSVVLSTRLVSSEQDLKEVVTDDQIKNMIKRLVRKVKQKTKNLQNKHIFNFSIVPVASRTKCVTSSDSESG